MKSSVAATKEYVDTKLQIPTGIFADKKNMSLKATGENAILTAMQTTPLQKYAHECITVTLEHFSYQFLCKDYI